MSAEEEAGQLSDEELERVLGELEAEETEVSRLRRRLHDRLASFPNEVTQQQEREISKRRRELHVRIDALRAERSKRRDEAVDG
jgi:anti-sigma-K factor RsiG